MQQVLDFFQKYLRYLLLLNVPAYVVTVGVLLVLNDVADWGLSYLLIAVIAVVANPGLWVALILKALDARFLRRAEKLAATPTEARQRRTYAALRRHNTAYMSVGKVGLDKSIDLSCLFVLIPLRVRAASWATNVPGSSEAERRRELRIAFEKRHKALATFGLGLDGDVKKAADVVRSEALSDFVEKLPEQFRDAKLGDVVLAAFFDGDGFTSALSAMYRLQMACALDEAQRADLVDVFGALGVVPDDFGWLAGRFFQAALAVVGGAVPRERLDRINALAAQAAQTLSSAADASARSSLKWDVRNQVLAVLEK